jgi:GT2 family glycosyltransferase
MSNKQKQEEESKKIVIGIPHTGILYTDVALSLFKMRSRHAINIQMLKSSILYISRENLVSAAFHFNADYIMFLDSDQTIEPDTVDRMAQHLINGEDIVTALIFRKDPPFQPCIFKSQKELPNHQIALEYYDVDTQDLTKPFYVESCGLGCAMIKLDVFKNINQPWFLPRPYTGEDIAFMWDVKQKGYKILCDPTINIGHYGIKNFTRDDYLKVIEDENRLLNGSVTPEVYL